MTKTESWSELGATARHEAGHAYAARETGLRVRQASIEPEEGTLGLLRHHPAGSWFQPDVSRSPETGIEWRPRS